MQKITTRKILRDSSAIGSDNLTADECLSRLQWNSSHLPRHRLLCGISLLSSPVDSSSSSSSSSSTSLRGTCRGFVRFSTCKYGDQCRYSHSFGMLSASCNEVLEHHRLQDSEFGDEKANAVSIIKTCSYEKWLELASSGLVDPLMLIFVEISSTSNQRQHVEDHEREEDKDTYQLSSVPIKERPAVLWSVYSSGSQLWTKAEEIEKSEEKKKRETDEGLSGLSSSSNRDSSIDNTTDVKVLPPAIPTFQDGGALLERDTAAAAPRLERLPPGVLALLCSFLSDRSVTLLLHSTSRIMQLSMRGDAAVWLKRLERLPPYISASVRQPTRSRQIEPKKQPAPFTNLVSSTTTSSSSSSPSSPSTVTTRTDTQIVSSQSLSLPPPILISSDVLTQTSSPMGSLTRQISQLSSSVSLSSFSKPNEAPLLLSSGNSDYIQRKDGLALSTMFVSLSRTMSWATSVRHLQELLVMNAESIFVPIMDSSSLLSHSAIVLSSSPSMNRALRHTPHDASTNTMLPSSPISMMSTYAGTTSPRSNKGSPFYNNNNEEEEEEEEEGRKEGRTNGSSGSSGGGSSPSSPLPPRLLAIRASFNLYSTQQQQYPHRSAQGGSGATAVERGEYKTLNSLLKKELASEGFIDTSSFSSTSVVGNSGSGSGAKNDKGGRGKNRPSNKKGNRDRLSSQGEEDNDEEEDEDEEDEDEEEEVERNGSSRRRHKNKQGRDSYRGEFEFEEEENEDEEESDSNDDGEEGQSGGKNNNIGPRGKAKGYRHAWHKSSSSTNPRKKASKSALRKAAAAAASSSSSSSSSAGGGQLADVSIQAKQLQQQQQQQLAVVSSRSNSSGLSPPSSSASNSIAAAATAVATSTTASAVATVASSAFISSIHQSLDLLLSPNTPSPPSSLFDPEFEFRKRSRLMIDLFRSIVEPPPRRLDAMAAGEEIGETLQRDMASFVKEAYQRGHHHHHHHHHQMHSKIIRKEEEAKLRISSVRSRFGPVPYSSGLHIASTELLISYTTPTASLSSSSSTVSSPSSSSPSSSSSSKAPDTLFSQLAQPGAALQVHRDIAAIGKHHHHQQQQQHRDSSSSQSSSEGGQGLCIRGLGVASALGTVRGTNLVTKTRSGLQAPILAIAIGEVSGCMSVIDTSGAVRVYGRDGLRLASGRCVGGPVPGSRCCGGTVCSMALSEPDLVLATGHPDGSCVISVLGPGQSVRVSKTIKFTSTSSGNEISSSSSSSSSPSSSTPSSISGAHTIVAFPMAGSGGGGGGGGDQVLVGRRLRGSSRFLQSNSSMPLLTLYDVDTGDTVRQLIPSTKESSYVSGNFNLNGEYPSALLFSSPFQVIVGYSNGTKRLWDLRSPHKEALTIRLRDRRFNEGGRGGGGGESIYDMEDADSSIDQLCARDNLLLESRAASKNAHIGDPLAELAPVSSSIVRSWDLRRSIAPFHALDLGHTSLRSIKGLHFDNDKVLVAHTHAVIRRRGRRDGRPQPVAMYWRAAGDRGQDSDEEEDEADDNDNEGGLSSHLRDSDLNVNLIPEYAWPTTNNRRAQQQQQPIWPPPLHNEDVVNAAQREGEGDEDEDDLEIGGEEEILAEARGLIGPDAANRRDDAARRRRGGGIDGANRREAAQNRNELCGVSVFHPHTLSHCGFIPLHSATCLAADLSGTMAVGGEHGFAYFQTQSAYTIPSIPTVQSSTSSSASSKERLEKQREAQQGKRLPDARGKIRGQHYS